MSKQRIFAADFETTVYDGQTDTEVWASACVELYNDKVFVFHSIEDQFEYFTRIKGDILAYYHNIKFDGSFWLYFLMVKLNYKQAYTTGESERDIEFLNRKDMPPKSFTYSISSMGQWYRITIRTEDKYIEFRDSLKLLPFTLRKIGESFKTEHQKLDMKYKGRRYAGCEITDEEKAYIKNDVLVLKEALEICFNQGHDKLTIGSCCLSEFKQTYDKITYTQYFPDLYNLYLPKQYEYPTVGEYIRRAYRGGWCYVVKGKENIMRYNGTTGDVNSLYPSMMSSESGNRYPIGKPTFWKGAIPPEAKQENKFFFVRFKTRFYIKPNKLPFVQIKGNLCYKGTENLLTSDIYDSRTKKYYRSYVKDGEEKPAIVTLTMTQTDYKLFLEHYYVEDFEILDGCYFQAEIGIFDEYINKYKKIKQESKGAVRELAKLFLNNLYGKMAASPSSNFKVAYIEDNHLKFFDVFANDKQAGYIPIGAAITSYARNFTIRAAQANYYGVDKAGFIYADTDSIHCDLPPNEIKGIRIHPTDFCAWKLEAEWDKAIFVRQKTYIEHIVKENGEDVTPHYNIRCAGLPERCKQLLIDSFEQTESEDNYNEEEKEFIKVKRDMTDFKVGLVVPSKLLPKQIAGGVLLAETTYEMR